jgi:SAM-dependent methyltransferase
MAARYSKPPLALVDDIPRYCAPENYAGSFGLQWNRFAATQLDRDRITLELSSDRFFRTTGWAAESLSDLDVLEVGSGAGRFSRVILNETRAILWSVDYSDAVEANLRNNRAFPKERFHLCQASIYELPFPDDTFDRVFCLGVLQHTPDFEASVRALVAKAKPGGLIVVDFYPIKGWWTKIHAKYLLRPITRRMSQARLLAMIERNVGWLMAVSRFLDRCRLSPLSRFLPLVDLATFPPGLQPDHAREVAILDTFDMFSPAYDQPQRVRDVARMFLRAGAAVTFSGFVENSDGVKMTVVRAVKP